MPTLRCYDHITAQLCPEAHCDPGDGTHELPHDPAAVDLELVPEAVSVYHGRALSLPCLATYRTPLMLMPVFLHSAPDGVGQLDG